MKLSDIYWSDDRFNPDGTPNNIPRFSARIIRDDATYTFWQTLDPSLYYKNARWVAVPPNMDDVGGWLIWSDMDVLELQCWLQDARQAHIISHIIPTTAELTLRIFINALYNGSIGYCIGIAIEQILLK